MTSKEQQLAIAELLEFKKEVGCTGIIRWRKGDELFDKLPDHLNDLNAVHHFENYVKQDDPHAYACYVSDLFEKYGSDAVSLPASIRAEELLKTIGKWIY